MDEAARSCWVVEQARALGFDLCGVGPVEDSEELGRLPEWLARGYAGEMGYLEDARRRSPAAVLEGARSLIVCALNYNTPLPYSTETPSWGEGTGTPERKDETRNWKCEDPPVHDSGPRGWLSRYAWGDDYHEVMRSKLEALVAALRSRFGQSFEARAYVDTGPVVERVAAKHAGLGWLGKNTCLINEKLGSWLFLGVIVTTLELAPSLTLSPSAPLGVNASEGLGPAESPPPDLCGNCRLCLEACPTGAIVEPYVLDARRCISYLTIELRGSIPEEFRQAMGRHVFGCDICQDVCPWNRKAPVTNLAAFQPRRFEQTVETRNSTRETRETEVHAGANSLFAPELEWLASLSEEEFREVFRGSAVRRTKWRGLVRNACVALGNSPISSEQAGVRPGTTAHSRIIALLERLAASQDEMIAEHAHWALSRLCEKNDF